MEYCTVRYGLRVVRGVRPLVEYMFCSLCGDCNKDVVDLA